MTGMSEVQNCSSADTGSGKREPAADLPFQIILMLARFVELGSTLEPGKPVKADKAAILSDATRMVIQLRAEAQQLKDTTDSLEEKIKELKVIYLWITVLSIVRTSFILFKYPSRIGGKLYDLSFSDFCDG
jgi:hypothetical protein